MTKNIDDFNKPTSTQHYALRIPGQAPQDLSKHVLINKNHKEHDGYFNNEGFHNHLLHHYLAAYSLGASSKRLQEIYDIHASYMRPLPPVRDITLTRETYRQELCNRDAYTSYLKFFEHEIEENGMIETVRRWIFKDDMLCQFIGGAFHPLIHLGYALEFNLSKVAAEALAITACDDLSLKPLFMCLTEQNAPAIKNGFKSIEKIVDEVHKDPYFEETVRFRGATESNAVLQRVALENPKTVAKIREYASQWHYKDTETSLKELYTTCIYLLTATAVKKEGIVMDFFLAHALTSVHAVYTIIPHLNSIQQELLLRGHLAASLMYYVLCGRPSFQVDLLAEYKSPQAVDGSENPWFDVFKLALDAVEAHCIKVVRAIALAQVVYGSPSSTSDDLLLKAAQVTVDCTGKGPSNATAWSFAGVGYKETWELRPSI